MEHKYSTIAILALIGILIIASVISLDTQELDDSFCNTTGQILKRNSTAWTCSNDETGNTTDTNETTRVGNIVNTSCSAGNFLYTFHDNGTGVCDAPSGSGDITSVVNDNSGYITGGADSGDVVIGFNETKLVLTIDANDDNSNCSASGSCNLIVYEGDSQRVSVHYDNVSHIPNCSSDEEYLTMINGVLSCDADDVGSDTTCDGGSCDIANTGTLDGYEASELLSTSGTYLNITPVAYSGDIDNGSVNGYIAAHNECNEHFAGTHLCNMAEITEYIGRYNTTFNGNDTWAIQFGPKYVPADIPVNDCNGWTHGAAGTYLGNYYHFDSNTGGDVRAIHCGTSFPLACCK